jgi:chorismate mutase/prephenate dehydratase
MVSKPDPDELIRIDQSIAKLVQKRAKVFAQLNPDHSTLNKGNCIVPQVDDVKKPTLSQDSLDGIFGEIQAACLGLVKPTTIAYLGPQATFTHQAALKMFGAGGNFVPQRTISDVFADVERKSANYGVVPIENSTEGAVTHTLDMFIDSELKIVAQIVLKIDHYFVSRSKSLKNISKLFVHPQALGQCRHFIQRTLPAADIFETSSNARSAELAKSEPNSAAITTGLAAHQLRLHVLQESVQDNPNNATRFFVLGPTMPNPSGKDRTSLMLSIKDSVGALHNALEPISRYKINMTKIESRPSKKRAWEYLFFLDLDGHILDSNVAEAVSHFEHHCKFLKVLGSYPKSS